MDMGEHLTGEYEKTTPSSQPLFHFHDENK